MLTKEQAIKLYDSKWWEGRTHRDIAGFQLFEPLLCCPFGVFQEAVEKSLGRPVFTHEFGLNLDGIKSEFLGTRQPPTFEEILAMIPAEKRILVFTEEATNGR